MSKILSWDVNSQSYLCNPLWFTNSSAISNNFHYWQTWCFFVVCHFHTTGICKQEKYSCYSVLTGLLCHFTGKWLTVECHTPPYHGLRAGVSVHVIHCVSQNFPGCGGESCSLLSELCKKLFFFSWAKNHRHCGTFLTQAELWGEFSTKGRRNELTLISLTSPPKRTGSSLLPAKYESHSEAASL